MNLALLTRTEQRHTAQRRSRHRLWLIGALAAATAAVAPSQAVGAVAPSTRAVGHLRAALATSNQLTQVAYTLVRDSKGGHANPGAEADLLFGANDEAFLYLADPNEALAEEGTYSYSDGKLALHISTADVKDDVNFALDLSASQVTMPFMVFSSGHGTSLWDRKDLDLGAGMQAIYNAAMNASNLSLTPAEGAQRAMAFAQAWLAAPPIGDPPVTDGRLRPGLKAPEGKCTEEGDNCITSVRSLGDDVLISYSDADPTLVMLYSRVPTPGTTTLTPSELASDPRVFLNPEVHPDSQFDPTNRSAAVIVPEPALETSGSLSHMEDTLHSRHYTVSELSGADATVEGIAILLKKAPGILLFSTHGNDGGMLLTASQVKIASGEKYQKAQAQFASQLDDEGFSSLANWKLNGQRTFTFAQPNCGFNLFKLSTVCEWDVLITPAFWNWLATKWHVNWSHSLVFISACETDANPALRNQIKAASYWAFSQDVWPPYATAVEEYLLDSLARPTHSPEEAYYNIVRIENTHQMIYKEDRLFMGLIGGRFSSASSFILDAYGWNGSKWVDYVNDGWMSRSVDQGEVWWILFAGRWDNNAEAGATALQTCFDKYWSQGEPGGLADQFCNSANSGLAHTKSRLARDVAYAVYLLIGKQPSGFPEGSIPPRWTMDD